MFAKCFRSDEIVNYAVKILVKCCEKNSERNEVQQLFLKLEYFQGKSRGNFESCVAEVFMKKTNSEMNR